MGREHDGKRRGSWLGLARRLLAALLTVVLLQLSWVAAAAAQAASDVAAPTGVSLTLVLAESDVLVTIDGTSRGMTPLAEPISLEPGRHRLELFKTGFERISEEVELASGTQTLSYQLRPETPRGTLSVAASSLPADLTLDGQKVGALPWKGEVAPGEHVLSAASPQLTTPEMASPELRIMVSAGQTSVVTLQMQARTGLLRIEVPQSSIFIDDGWVGTDTWRGRVPVGKHRVVLKRAGYATKELAIELATDEELVIANVDWGAPTAPALPPPVSPWPGLYAQLGLFGLFGGKGSDTITADCPATPSGGSCSAHRSYGGGLGLRVGYSFGWIAVEGLALSVTDAWYGEADYESAATEQQSPFYGPARTEQYTFLRYGAAFGVGARLLSPTKPVRGTFGLAFGVMQRWERLFRVSSTMSTVSSPLGTTSVPDARAHASSVDSQAVPVLLVDAGVLLGSTPGLKFHLGLLFAATFGSDTQVAPRTSTLGRDSTTGESLPYGTPALDVTQGTQWFWGPTLGVQFGH